MVKRGKQSKRLLAVMLSAAMAVLNVSTAVPVYAAPSADEFREDAELINDLGLSRGGAERIAAEGHGKSFGCDGSCGGKAGRKDSGYPCRFDALGYAVQCGKGTPHRIKRR